MLNVLKKIKPSKRGLTFSLSTTEATIGQRYTYFVDKLTHAVHIVPDENGRLVVSRKKSGNGYKPLFDIRSKEVRTLCEEADYLQIEFEAGVIYVHTFKRAQETRRDVTSLNEVLGQRTGEIVLTEDSNLFLCDDDSSLLLTKSFFRESTNRETIKKVYDVISLFSGAGLLENSFKDEQFRFVFGIDFDKDACETYRHNIGNNIKCMDIRKLDPSQVPNADVCIGGPCCQAYSNSNRRNIKSKIGEEKRLLIDDYIKIVKAKKVKVFVIENVPQFLTREDGKYLDRVLTGLPEYDITYTVIADEAVGGYTQRKRAIVIGSRIGRVQLPTIEIQTVKTVRDALKNVDATWFNWNDVTKPRKETKKLMQYVPQGGNWTAIPKEIRSFGPATQSNIYRRLSWTESAPTLVNWRKCNIMHPEEDRILSVSEASALMGLTKDFKIYGNSLDSKQQQISNGVTYAIGSYIKKCVLNVLNNYTRRLQYSI